MHDPSRLQGLSANINRKSLLGSWEPIDCAFQSFGTRTLRMPSICTVYVPGVIAFRADLVTELFPRQCAGLEFLPINADGEQWQLLNCMNTVAKFDESSSQVMRGMGGEVFMVLKLTVTDPAAGLSEMFTLSQSNRMQLFVTASFKSRVDSQGLEGITFHRIGEIA